MCPRERNNRQELDRREKGGYSLTRILRQPDLRSLFSEQLKRRPDFSEEQYGLAAS